MQAAIAGFGEGTPQQVSREGQNRRIADFGTVVETCSVTAADLPLSGFPVHRTDRTGLAARCGRSFFLSPKILLKGYQLPAGRGFFKISLCPLPRTIIKNAKRRGKNFSLTYYSNLKGSKRPKTEPVKIVRGGSTPCCRPLIAYLQRRSGLSTAARMRRSS